MKWALSSSPLLHLAPGLFMGEPTSHHIPVTTINSSFYLKRSEPTEFAVNQALHQQD